MKYPYHKSHRFMCIGGNNPGSKCSLYTCVKCSAQFMVDEGVFQALDDDVSNPCPVPLAFHLLKDWEVADLKEWAKLYRDSMIEGRRFMPWESPNVSRDGDVAVKCATGRARCRIDGVKIPKGNLEIVFFKDVAGEGSFTPYQFHVSVEKLLS